MNTSGIIDVIDQEIYKLQQVRALLDEPPAIHPTKPTTGKRRGRPKGSINKKAEVAAPVATNMTKRTMSAEGKAKIAAAQKARWAAQKKTIRPASTTAKKVAAKPAKKTVLPLKPAAKVNKKVAVPFKNSVAEPVLE